MKPTNDKPVGSKRGGPIDPPFVVIDRRTTPADEGPADPPRSPAPPIEELQARAKSAERRAKEISAAYLTMERDQAALRDRLERDRDRRVAIARADVLRKMLGVLDDLERTLAAASSGAAPAALIRGVAITRDHLLSVLASEGVERVETVGLPFDPSIAEAVETEPADDPALDGRVVAELTGGYMLSGSLLRAARVRVARHASPAPSPADPYAR